MSPEWYADTQDFEDVVFSQEDLPYEELTDEEEELTDEEPSRASL